MTHVSLYPGTVYCDKTGVRHGGRGVLRGLTSADAGNIPVAKASRSALLL